MENKNVKYIPAELEIITFECNDIVTTSIVPDENEEEKGDW